MWMNGLRRKRQNDVLRGIVYMNASTKAKLLNIIRTAQKNEVFH